MQQHRRVRFADRLRYAFDNTMSAGTIALIGWLGLLSLAVVMIAGLLVVILGVSPGDTPDRLSFFDATWMSLMRTLDAGTMGGDTGWGFRLVMFAVTLGGVFFVSTLIGVLSNGIEDKLDDLRRGRSQVLEENHTLILGWSSKIFTILSELAIANANQKKPRIVILADKDKVEMETEIRERVGPTRPTRIICRTGSAADVADLEIVNPHGARSIIILSPDTDEPDAQVIKSVLAITSSPSRRPEPYHIVAELHNPKSAPIARMVGKDEVEIVLPNDFISRVTVQTCRQVGLSVAITELLDFGGDEIYFTEAPPLTGRTFAEALLAYEDSSVLGLQFKDGVVKLNPPMDTRLAAGDRVVAVAEDDDTVKLSGLASVPIDTALIRTPERQPASPERTLILGWNKEGSAIIRELDNYVAPGSQLLVVADVPGMETAVAECSPSLRNLKVDGQAGDPTDRDVLDSLAVPSYLHVILLCSSDELTPQQADSRTLVTLLHLREIAQQSGHTFSIVSEMLDVRNRRLAEVTRADDFIVSDTLTSLLLAQISENKALAAVFADLFDADGSEIYLKPASDYVALGQPASFYTVVESASRRGEVAFGYRQAAHAGDAAKAYGVTVNPDKSKPVTFEERDRIIVLAES